MELSLNHVLISMCLGAEALTRKVSSLPSMTLEISISNASRFYIRNPVAEAVAVLSGALVAQYRESVWSFLLVSGDRMIPANRP